MERKEWTEEETKSLITSYEENECLWNTNHKHYRNRERKARIIAGMARDFGCAPHEVQRKLHNLRNQVSQELKKMRTKKDRSGTDDFPSSGWKYFASLAFLVPSLTTKPLESNLSQDLYFPENIDGRMSKKTQFYKERKPSERSSVAQALESCKLEVSDVEENISILPEVLSSSSRKKSQASSIAVQVPCPKRAKASNTTSANETITGPQCVMNKSSTEDEFQQFANHVATQLRHLPLENALLLQEKIQSLITQERIACIALASGQFHELTKVYVASPSSVNDEY